MGARLVLADDQEAYTVGPSAVFLCIHLSLCKHAEGWLHCNEGGSGDSLSAIEATMRLTGMGRLKAMRDAIACWRIKLL